MIRNIALKIAYFGANYYGWQVQPNLPTIQGTLRETIEKITGERVRIFGASRTDRGVHALCQIANFKTTSSVPPEKFKDALNSVLPDDIRILHSTEISEGFLAKKSVVSKTYRYLIYLGQPFPALQNLSWCISRKFDVELFWECVRKVEGTHNFCNFTTSKEKRTIKKVDSVSLHLESNLLIFEIKAQSFLQYMIRYIVGSAVKVAVGEEPMDYFIELLENVPRGTFHKDEVTFEEKTKIKIHPFRAPPQGLYLVKVKYNNQKWNETLGL